MNYELKERWYTRLADGVLNGTTVLLHLYLFCHLIFVVKQQFLTPGDVVGFLFAFLSVSSVFYL